jgi:hypothetical protein
VGNGQSVQRAELGAVCLLFVRLRGARHGAIGDERDDRVDPGIQALDAREMRGHHLTRRHLLFTNPGGELGSAEVAQLVCGRGWRRSTGGRQLG